MKVADIKPYSKNAKKHPKKQVEQVANSIKAFGFNQPVVVDKNNVLIVGHGRLEAAKLLGLTDVPAIVVDLTEEQANAYRLADNKLNESEWDMKLVIEELKGLSEPMLDLTGFDKDLILEADEADDEVPDVPEEPQSKLGDLYELGNHRVLCGDSTKIEDVTKLMDGKKADMVFTDPPYGMDFQSNFREKTPQFEKLKNDDVILDISPVLHSFMKQDSVAYICTRWDLYPQWYQQIEKIFDIKNCVVWYKKGGGLGDLENSYLPNHEFIIVAHKGKSQLRGKRDADVWQIGRDGFNDYKHPTQKPVELPAFAISHHSDDKDIVIDLFLGSGSTLIASEKTGRICYGMELDPKYVDVCVQRWVDYTGVTEIKKNGNIIQWPKKADPQ